MAAWTFARPVAPLAPTRGEVVVRASGVGVRLGGKQIIAGVDCEARAGEVLAVIGPNGAGKSTLLGALAGDHAHEGSIEVAGRELGSWSARDLALRRCVLRQSNAVSFPFSVLEVVKMARAPWRGITSVETDNRIVAQELLRTDTFDFAERTFPSLSGGEQARVSLARAMAQRSSVLLLDEPTAALDINYQEHVLALARRYARRGGTVIVVLHDLAAAAAYADRVLLMAEGRVVASGAPGEVMTAPRLSEVYRHPVRVLDDGRGGLLIAPERFADDDASTDEWEQTLYEGRREASSPAPVAPADPEPSTTPHPSPAPKEI